MTDAERIRKLTEWMEWEWIDPLHIKDKGGYVFDGTHWNPLTRIQDVDMLEGEVFKRGLEWKYVPALIKVIHGPHTKYHDLTVRGVWFLIRATPEQRCAAIEALMEDKCKQ